MKKIDIEFVNFNWKIKHLLNSSKLPEYKLLLIKVIVLIKAEESMELNTFTVN
jgi:hypothetical protein